MLVVMKKISQRLFLILSAALMTGGALSTLATYKAPGADAILTDYFLGSTSLTDGAGQTVSSMPWALMVLAVIVVAVSLFTLFLTAFQNYELQKRMTLFNLVLVVGYLITYIVFFLYYQHALEAVSSGLTWWGMAAPVVVLILQWMSFNAIRSTEAAVLKEATTFRLRD